jgi:iron complex outermembrane receptor protein
MRFIAIILFFTTAFAAHAQQGVVHGILNDAATQQPAPYVYIKNGKQVIAVTDSLGRFRFNLPYGKYSLSFEGIGYKTLMRTVTVSQPDMEINPDIEPYTNVLTQVVVSASRHEKKISQEVVSLNIIKPDLIMNTNSVDLADVVNRVPGVNVVDGQPTIRGGVGFSYNTGSRVMVLLDDMPLMGPEVGDVQWRFLPIEAADQIEVVKGTNSVLYGSSALNGSINVRTGWPTKKPETKVTFFQGVYQNPKRLQQVWWKTGSQPNQSGTFFSHKQQFGNFDLVWTGNIYTQNSYLQQADNNRARMYIKTRYRDQKIKGLSYGVNINMLMEKTGRFYLWQDGDTNIFKPYGGEADQFPFFMLSIDPHITYEKKNGTRHALKMRYYDLVRYPDKIRFPIGRGANAQILAIDYSFKKIFFKNFISTTGTYLTFWGAHSNNYPGKFKGLSGAAYSQLEYLKSRWSAVAGFRYEINALGVLKKTPRPLFRSGINYKVAKKTHLRLSYGEGYRFPTIAERYVQDLASDLPIYPNSDLKSEFGWSGEFGVNQGFTVGGFNGYIDYAAYWMEYTDMIEYTFKQWYPPQQPGDPLGLGFKPINIGRARVAGMEASISGEGKIGNVLVRTLGGFTYSYPINLVYDTAARTPSNYVKKFFSNTKKADSADVINMLPYRNRSLLKWDIDATYKRFTIGYSIFFYGVNENIDLFLLYLVPGLKRFQERVGPGDWIHNIRFQWKASNVITAGFMVNNLLNHEYAIRPAKPDAPRNFLVQVRYEIR